MFKVYVGGLKQGKPLEVVRSFPPESTLWDGTGLTFRDDVGVEVTLTATASGQILVQGHARGVMHGECRRCLEPLEHDLHVPFEVVWSPPDLLGDPETVDDGVYPLEPGESEVDLGEVLREEVILTAPEFLVCREDCLGLCPTCGSNRNDIDCNCTQEEHDPRWSALRALKRD
jgi:uncharacterized protein